MPATSSGSRSRWPGRSAGRASASPTSFDYASIPHLRAEAREKLVASSRSNLGQACRISGITPADLALVLAHLEGKLRS